MVDICEPIVVVVYDPLYGAEKSDGGSGCSGASCGIAPCAIGDGMEGMGAGVE